MHMSIWSELSVCVWDGQLVGQEAYNLAHLFINHEGLYFVLYSVALEYRGI